MNNICDKCKNVSYRLVNNKDTNGMWLCPKCLGYKHKPITYIEKVKSRVRMDDGTILDGARGRKVISERLQKQKEMQKKSGGEN